MDHIKSFNENWSHPVLVKYKKWREENDEDYCHDEVHEFLADLSRSEMMSFLDWCLKNCH
jgi:hypothetical protein